jgi:ferric-dicitrate binding protein FerR (iron transport regulator)
MTPERFDSLVAAYGGDARRWPAGERDAARAYAADHPEALRDAVALDALLASHVVGPADAGLISRILASRPAPVDWRRWGAGLGAGLAAACAAGVVFGIQVSQSAVRDARTEAVITSALDANATTGADLVQEGEG